MDKIYIKNLVVFANHGAYVEEKNWDKSLAYLQHST